MALYYFLEGRRLPLTAVMVIFTIVLLIHTAIDRDWLYLAGLAAPIAYFGGMPFNASWRYTREEFNQLKQNRQSKQSKQSND